MVAMVFATTSSFVSCKDNIDDDLSDVYANLGKRSADLQNQIDGLQGDIDDLQKQIDDIEPLIINYGDTIINQIIERFDTTIVQKVDDLDSMLQIINEQITNQTLAIDSINNALTNIDVRLNNVGDSVNVLWTRVDSIVGLLDALVGGTLITGVDIEATRNDVLGIVNTPLFNCNGLAAYYGTNESSIDKFPYSGVDFNVGGRRLACYLEPNELPYEGFVEFDSDIITDSYGNAGQLYFTVNSTDYDNFDISKLTKIQIENSVGEVAPIDLKVRKSSARVNWNLGRAFLEETGTSVNNGFYVADATIKEDDLDPSEFGIKKFIDFKKLQNEIKVLAQDMKEREGENGSKTIKATFKNCLREAMSLVFDLMKNELTPNDLANNISYSPQRLAFFVEKDGKMKRVAQSKIELFTTAVKPLSYNTFWEYEKAKDGNWILEEKLENAISKIASEINKRWGNKGINAKIVSLDDASKTVKVNANGNIETVLVNDTQYWEDLKKAINSNGGLDAVNDKLAKLLKTYTLGTAVDQAENRINTWIDKGSDMLTEWINKHLFTRALAPIIIFETDYGMDRLCEGMIFNRGTMHAYLTSGTLELLAPAYKKYVALEKNGMLLQSEVLPGNTLTYDYDLSEKGDYQIILSCVDYFGYVITKKYNVHVK
jgi:hypothetical protein